MAGPRQREPDDFYPIRGGSVTPPERVTLPQANLHFCTTLSQVIRLRNTQKQEMKERKRCTRHFHHNQSPTTQSKGLQPTLDKRISENSKDNHSTCVRKGSMKHERNATAVSVMVLRVVTVRVVPIRVDERRQSIKPKQ